MARSVGGGIAEGIESGFNMGLQADQAELRKKADQRAEADSNLRATQARQSERRQGLRDNLDLLDRQQRLVTGRQQEIVGLSTAAQTAGQPVDPDLAREYGQNAEALTGLRQKALDFFSRAQTGQIDPLAAPPAELYTHLVAATGRPLAELRAVPQYTADVQAGLETGNQGLLVQGVNGLLAPQLRRGVGTPSPHGGTITRKEVIGMDPAVDANHNPLPGKFMPRLRVYVKGEDGAEKYYDAPMTVDGSGEADDRVAVIDVAHAMQWMGNLGTLATAIQRPDVAAKLDAGEKEAGGTTKRYLDQLTAISRPKTQGTSGEKLALIERYARENKLTTEDAAKRLQSMGVLTTLGSLGQKLAAIDDLDVTPAEKVALRRDVTLGAGGRTTGLIKKPGGSGAVKASPALGGASAPSGSTADSVDYWARAAIAGDRDWQVGIGRTKEGSALILAVKNRIPELAKQMGITPQEFGSTRAQSAALAVTLKELTKRSEAVELFASKIEKDMRTFDSVLDKAAGSSPLLINKPINALRRQFSDPDLAQLDLAAKQVGAEYERLITGGTLSMAQLHAGASEDAKKLLNGDMPPKQARAVMEVMRREMQNARAAAHESRTSVIGQMQQLGKGNGNEAPGAAPAPAATAKPAPPAVGAVVKGYRFKGGDPASPASWEKVQ